MSTLDPITQAALEAPVITIAGLLQIDLPAHTVRLADGGAAIAWNGGTFSGRDDLFGIVESVDGLSTGIGSEAPALDVVFAAPLEPTLDEVASPDFQDATVQLWVVVIDQASGAVTGGQREFFGLVDTITVEPQPNGRRLGQQIVSGFERLFAENEGERLSDAFHQNIWPGETGYANVTGITLRTSWGKHSSVGARPVSNAYRAMRWQ